VTLDERGPVVVDEHGTDVVRTPSRGERAAELRVQGYPWREIAERLDFYDGHTARRSAMRATAGAIGSPDYERSVWYERLTDLYGAMHRKGMKGSAAHARVAVQIATRMSMMLGLDAPTTHLVGTLDEGRDPYNGLGLVGWIRAGGDPTPADREAYRIDDATMARLREGT